MADQPIIGANGDVFFGPVGTEKPKITEPVPETLRKVGLISEEGVTFGNSRDTSDIQVWQSFYAARRLTTSIENTLAFSMATWSRDSVSFAFGGGTWSGNAEDGYTFTPPEPGHEAESCVLVRWVDGDFSAQLFLPRAVISENEDLTLRRDEAALLGVTVAVLGQANTAPWELDSADARFAPDNGDGGNGDNGNGDEPGNGGDDGDNGNGGGGGEEPEGQMQTAAARTTGKSRSSKKAA